jgi:FtsP/CotA-like multicopper oxidase with cupredoxin domain
MADWRILGRENKNVDPVTVEEIRMGVAETYDVILQPPDDRAYTIFAQSIDRSGFARATLAPRASSQADVPPLDPKTWLTITNMGMGDMKSMSSQMSMKDMKSSDPAQDMRVMNPSRALDDPGPRLRGNGRRMLTYADLHTVGGARDKRSATREIPVVTDGEHAALYLRVRRQEVFRSPTGALRPR